MHFWQTPKNVSFFFFAFVRTKLYAITKYSMKTLAEIAVPQILSQNETNFQREQYQGPEHLKRPKQSKQKECRKKRNKNKLSRYLYRFST